MKKRALVFLLAIGCGSAPREESRVAIPKTPTPPPAAPIPKPEPPTHVELQMVRIDSSWAASLYAAVDAKVAREWLAEPGNAKWVRPPTAHILVKTGDTADSIAKAEKKANAILARVKKGEDFGKLAKESSDDPGSKDKGGEYPGEMVENFVDEYRRAYDALAPGELTKTLVKTHFGFHIIKKLPLTDAAAIGAYGRAHGPVLAKKLATVLLAELEKGSPFDRALRESMEGVIPTKALGDANRPKVESISLDHEDGESGECTTLRNLDAGATTMIAAESDVSFVVGTKRRVPGLPPEKVEQAGAAACTTLQGTLTPEQIKHLIEQLQKQKQQQP
jgi:hypothetical protein